MSLTFHGKKPVLILTTFTSIIEALKEAYAVEPAPTLPLKHISCIYHPACFKKNQAKVHALIDFDDEVNVITLLYAARLSFKI